MTTEKTQTFLKIVLFPFQSQMWKLIALGGIDSGAPLTDPLPPPPVRAVASISRTRACEEVEPAILCPAQVVTLKGRASASEYTPSPPDSWAARAAGLRFRWSGSPASAPRMCLGVAWLARVIEVLSYSSWEDERQGASRGQFAAAIAVAVTGVWGTGRGSSRNKNSCLSNAV